MQGLAILKSRHLDPTVRSTVHTQLLSLRPMGFFVLSVGCYQFYVDNRFFIVAIDSFVPFFTRFLYV